MKTWREVRITPKVRKYQRTIENLKPAIVKCMFGQICIWAEFGLAESVLPFLLPCMRAGALCNLPFV